MVKLGEEHDSFWRGEFAEKTFNKSSLIYR
jgi:hypothetical protein